jgi:hypothetical protein
LCTPKQVRHGLAYVLCNARKHRAAPSRSGWLDPCSSALVIDLRRRASAALNDLAERLAPMHPTVTFEAFDWDLTLNGPRRDVSMGLECYLPPDAVERADPIALTILITIQSVDALAAVDDFGVAWTSYSETEVALIETATPSRRSSSRGSCR